VRTLAFTTLCARVTIRVPGTAYPTNGFETSALCIMPNVAPKSIDPRDDLVAARKLDKAEYQGLALIWYRVERLLQRMSF
jgi:hypothetical protein